MAVFRRLGRKRGIVYLVDLLLGRRCRKRYLDPAVRIFPEIAEGVVADVQGRCQHLDIDDPHSDATLKHAAALKPDYILFLGAPVIKPCLFTLARRGAINWHHGISPQYRGSDCVLWAMSRNDFDTIGFTIHFVSEVVDGGKIILQRRVAVRRDVAFSEAIADVARNGIAGFIDVVNGIISGNETVGRDQDKGGAHFPPIGLSGIRRAYANFVRYSRRSD
jgi:methionyl-tRNA formyltransferase